MDMTGSAGVVTAPPPSEAPSAGLGAARLGAVAAGAPPGAAAGPGEDELAALRPAWVGVDLDALAGNLGTLHARIGGARALAVIKADAYGHGAVPVARTLARHGVDWLGVALVEEGAEVRRALDRDGPAASEPSILVLGTSQPAQLPSFARHRLTPTLSSLEQLAIWREHTSGWSTAQPFHLKVDTGIGRLGVPAADVARALELVRASPGLRLAGLLSHLADADDLTSERTSRQAERFAELLALLTAAERRGLLVHLANSAGALHHPATRFDLVRLGLGLYGLDPASRLPAGSLAPVMSLVARIVSLRDVPAGTAIGYGGRWTARRDSRVAVLPVGYADGYAWRLGGAGGRARGLLAGTSVPVVGAVSMDMCFVDVTDAPQARLGDPVVLLGQAVTSTGAPDPDGARIEAGELAAGAGTIPWETLCLLGLRLPRRYLAAGRTVEVRSRFVAAGSGPPAGEAGDGETG